MEGGKSWYHPTGVDNQDNGQNTGGDKKATGNFGWMLHGSLWLKRKRTLKVPPLENMSDLKLQQTHGLKHRLKILRVQSLGCGVQKVRLCFSGRNKQATQVNKTGRH